MKRCPSSYYCLKVYEGSSTRPLAGWTTANPTIYRAGLAFQAMFPRSSRQTMTLVAGGIATIAALFPAFAFKLLGFVGLYGTILAPMGAVIFADWFLARRAGIQPFHAEKTGQSFNPAVLLAWIIPVSIAIYFIWARGVTPWYFPLPAWITCAILYLLFSRLFQKPSHP